ncbi:MAG: radical SAM protein [Endomicrobium sp.]|jgi:threonylcarbamoyladenosine tRNA methylthiotransferase MtaB|nr:radical SAM protein [Endomicrobium sp.]
MNKYYYIYTFGCKVNQYESQLISETMKKNNFQHTWLIEKASLIIVNSCTVTAETDAKCINLLDKLSKFNKSTNIILTGCLSRNKSINLKSLYPNIHILTDKTKLFSNYSIKNFDFHSRAFVKIQDGCNHFCSYCIIPYIRNILYSKKFSVILSEIQQLISNGYFEIVLTGINLGEYEYGLANLLEKLVTIPMNFRIRLSSIELNTIDNRIINILSNYPSKICHHLHIPLQSGSNPILQLMNRKYSAEEFLQKINAIFDNIPDLTLTTDIITGFPGETNEYHNETCKFLEKVNFAKLHIFKYSDRGITQASLLRNKISPFIINKRARELRLINLKKNKYFIQKNFGIVRPAVQIGYNQALTDNYIKIPHKQQAQEKGVFNVLVTKKATI